MSIQVADDDLEEAPLYPDPPRNRLHVSASDSSLGISPIISETDTTITIRRPVHYPSVRASPAERRQSDDQTRATLNRYKYYSRLDPQSESSLLMPNHVVPSLYYLVVPVQEEQGKQNSIVTIFSIWNTMLGTSVLSMPWALEQAGFGFGIGIMILFAAISLYTSYRVMSSIKPLSHIDNMYEFTDVCEYYLGRTGKYLSITFSLLTLLGAAIVYWVLMSNFLYNSVKFIYEEATGGFNTTSPTTLTNYTDAFCPHPPAIPSPMTTLPPPTTTQSLFHPVAYQDEAYKLIVANQNQGYNTNPLTNQITAFFGNGSSDQNSTSSPVFDKVWDQTLTVPFFLLFILMPLINFKSPTFFTKFNSLGTISVVYILSFVAIKAAKWGFHLDFDPTHYNAYIPEFQWTFPALTGTLSLAFFIHNCVLSIVRTQKNPENNGRDLSIAFLLVGSSYIYVGVLFYSSYPLEKGCIEDNLLNNFQSSDILAFVARLFLLFQMVTVFPLLMYIFRAQFLSTFCGDVYPSLKHVILVNAMVLACCLMFAIFLPQIGTIIRFSGALCGLAYVFTLPCIVYMMERRAVGTLTWPIIVLHCIIMVIGVANFVAQFLITFL